MTMEALPAAAGILLVLALVAFVLWPLVTASGELAAPGQTDFAAERLRLYRQVIELEFDVQTGKLAQEDYTQLSAQLLGQASALLSESGASEDEVEQEIEREIAAARRAISAHRATSSEVPA